MDWLGRVQVELTATPQQESDAESCTDEHQPMQEKEVSPIDQIMKSECSEELSRVSLKNDVDEEFFGRLTRS